MPFTPCICSPFSAFDGHGFESAPMSPRKRKPARSTAESRRSAQRQKRRQLLTVRRDFKAAIVELKSLGCEDTMILVEFWHALDHVNREESHTL